MSDQDLTQLEARAESLWAEVDARWKHYIEKSDEWCAVNQLIQIERERSKLRAEILDEQKVA